MKLQTLVVLALLASGCARSPRGLLLCMPQEIDGILVRIDRRTEAEIALAMIGKLESRGLRDAAAAAYEFYVMRNKPVFHFVIARGEADRADLLQEAVSGFDGKRRADKQPAQFTRDGVVYLCASFTRGPGLVGLSGACAFSDGQTAGYGVRTDGGDASDALKYTAAARRGYMTIAGKQPDGCGDARHLAERAKRPSDRDGIAREAVAAIKGYDCEILAGLFPAGSEEFFAERVTPDLRGRMEPLEWVCFVLGTLAYPDSETMKINAVGETPERVLLRVSQLTEQAELGLVRDGPSWKVDREWALGKVFDHRVKLDLANLASTTQQYGRMTGSFSDDPEEVTRRTHIVAKFRRGLATLSSNPGEAHVALGNGNQWACVTVLSRSGAFFMIRVEKERWTNARFQTPPKECPALPLQGDW